MLVGEIGDEYWSGSCWGNRGWEWGDKVVVLEEDVDSSWAEEESEVNEW